MPRAHRRTDGAHCAHARTHAHAYTYTRTTSSFVMSYTNRTLRIVMSHTNRTLLITHLHAIPSHPTTSLHLPLHPNPRRPPISFKRNINYIIKQNINLFRYPLEDNVEANRAEEARCIEGVRQTIKSAASNKGQQVAAVIVEPIQAEGGDRYRLAFVSTLLRNGKRTLRIVMSHTDLLLF